MPDKGTLARVARDKRKGKSASTQAGEFVRDEIVHVREGKHGARSAKQVIAIGLSKARRAGINVAKPKSSGTSIEKRANSRSKEDASTANGAPGSKRSDVSLSTLKREGSYAASHEALSKHAKSIAKKREGAEHQPVMARNTVKTKVRSESLSGTGKKVTDTRSTNKS